jgi:urease accessory protein
VRGVAASGRMFAANRSVGRIALAVAGEGGVTRRRRVYEDGPLRVRFPNAEGGRLEAVTVNTAGGIAGGDRHDISVSAERGAELTVTTAAAEKVYRALDAPAEISLKLSVDAGARLAWLPQETILFDGVGLSRRIEVDVAEGGSVLVAEAVVFGRSAMGESVRNGSFNDRWRVRHGGRLVLADSVRLSGDVSGRLAEPAVAAGGVAMATVVAVPGDDGMAARVRALDDIRGEVGISVWNGLAVARLCAKDGAALRRDLAAVLGALGAPLPRIWLN